MVTLKIIRHLDSETLHLPELRPLVGKNVEITVTEAERAGAGTLPREREALHGSVLRYDDPFTPVGDDDWEAAK